MQVLIAAAIFIGIALLIAATVQTQRLIGKLPSSSHHRSWKWLQLFMVFFGLGYLLAIADLLFNEFKFIGVLTGIVFLIGALFVLIVVHVGRKTIIELKETMLDKSEKELLLKEIHHRVKNNLQIINSLLNLQSSKVDDELLHNAFRECRRRTQTMALIHDNLYRSDNLATIDLNTYFTNLLEDMIETYELNATITYQTDIQVSDASMDTVIPLGLILSEIISNSLKHAFVGRDKGTIYLSIQRDHESCRLLIRDDGIGIKQEYLEAERPTLGIDLIEALVEQLDGTLEVTNDNGTVYSITCACPFAEESA
jgi:two-component system, sensor histidine kinase PdtaS